MLELTTCLRPPADAGLEGPPCLTGKALKLWSSSPGSPFLCWNVAEIGLSQYEAVRRLVPLRMNSSKGAVEAPVQQSRWYTD